MFCPQFLGDYCGIHKGSLKFGFHNSTGKWQRIGRQLTHVVCQRIMAAHGPSWADDSPWRISGLTEKNRICTASCPDVPRAINFHGPCISAVLPPHASLVAIAPGMATILLKCWFWVHCSICGKLLAQGAPCGPCHPETIPRHVFSTNFAHPSAPSAPQSLPSDAPIPARNTAPGWSLDSSWGRSLKMMQFHNETFQAHIA